MSLPHHAKLAFRGLVRHKAATLVICLSLAVAVAGNAIVFSLIEALILRPFPYPDSQRLTFVWLAERNEPDDETPASPADFIDWREGARSFSALEAFRLATYNLTGGDQPEEVTAVVSTPGGLALLGAEPQLGRALLPEEGEPGGERVALLSHDLWQRRFGGEPGIVGETIQLDDVSYAVVGVLPPDFEFFLPGFGVWTPLALDPADLPRDRRDLIVLGRLAAGVAPDAARAEMDALARRLEAEHPATHRGLGVRVNLLREEIPGPTDRKLFSLLQGGMLFVLLIACANIANVLLARAQDRQREIALRTTLGAGRRRVVAQLLTESLLLAGVGGALGVALGGVGIEVLSRMVASELPKMAMPTLNGPVLAFTLGVSAAAGLLFGLAPAVAASRPDLAGTLKEGGRGAAGRRRRWVSRGLVVAQVTLALMMLSGTALLVRSIVELQSLDPGFPVADVLTFRLSLPEARYPEDADVVRFYDELTERLAALPGVTGATAATSLPRSRRTPSAPFTRDDRPQPETGQPPSAVLLSVTPGYFEELGIPVLAGRTLAAGDLPGDAPVAVISRGMARRHFGGDDPLGRSLAVEGASRRIVGVVGDVVQGRLMDREGESAILYLPHPQKAARALYLMLGTAGGAPGLPDLVRREVWALDAALPVAEMRTLEEHIALQFAGARVIAGLVGAFGVVALLLAAVGLYGIISYSVSRRTREIGVRMAIGARPGHVVGLITRQGLLLAGIGLALGVPGVVLVHRAIQSTLGDIAPVAVATLPAVAVALAAVALLASYVPARRAAALDPVTALRVE